MLNSSDIGREEEQQCMQRKMAAIRTLSTTSFPLIILVVFAVTAAAQETFNVENYGAKSDGKTDCSKVQKENFETTDFEETT